jgi:hypothetical protein
MAVVQISRIQVRRGKSLSGTGLPQLASGELAWSLDTQELYIGNGSVAEGSPAVGNTKILTERDLTVQGNLLNLIQHIYKSNDPAIQTGPTSNDPVSRQTQDRLDDRVTVKDFGATGDGATDDTAALQRAIDQLFLNSSQPSYSASVQYPYGTPSATATRIILELAPGIYKITSTLYIPSYATLVGAGPDKTVISYTGSGTGIRFVNDTSTIGNPSSLGGTTGIKQPRNINLKGLTLYTNTDDQIGLQLDAVKDSKFEDLIIRGAWGEVYDSNSIGISMNAVSSLVTCANNSFNNVSVTGFSFAIWAKQDIINNSFTSCTITNVRQGFVLGLAADGTTEGEQFGPRQTQITNSKFDNVKRHAIYVGRGIGNTSRDNLFNNVGNNGAGVYFPEYPQIYFESVGNTSQNDQSDRESSLNGRSFTEELTLNYPITAKRGDTVVQNVTGITGSLKENYTNATVVTIVTKYLTPFNTTNTLVIAGDFRPGNETTITITSSNGVTDAYQTSNTTSALIVGTAIRFAGTIGGIVQNQIYYVKEVIDNTHFSIVETFNNAFDVGVSAKQLSTQGPTTVVATFEPTVRPTVVGALTLVPYIPEVSGNVLYPSYATNEIKIGYMPSWSTICILPLSTDPNGNALNSVGYQINYQFKSVANTYTRKGTLSIIVDVDDSNTANTTRAQLSDDYNVIGLGEEDSLLLEFRVVVLNQIGSELSSPSDTPASLALLYKNALLGETLSTFSYSYIATHQYPLV